MLEFDPQGLPPGYRIPDHIALGRSMKWVTRRALGSNRAVAVEPQIAADRICDQAAALPGYRDDALLHRRQPVHQVAGDSTVVEHSAHGDQVLVRSAAG